MVLCCVMYLLTKHRSTTQMVAPGLCPALSNARLHLSCPSPPFYFADDVVTEAQWPGILRALGGLHALTALMFCACGAEDTIFR